ncbi:hypothetical protein [Paenibacillus tundrae]|uniref:Ead/Ea22-like family protein n=1 Tax=Paenibacillus tundrae TaxID=528187 RepID=A0ABT9W782_9BACL|nr:hypothetical protein [Paenibacillus tundrae]MDQ0168705.1 hypothetical protein [Paenibacillus tundrae]
MTTETKRDLQADLALCNAASPGPWFVSGNDERPVTSNNYDIFYARGSELAYVGIACEDEEFIAESREGWPESIRRAIAAEEKLTQLVTALESKISMLDTRIDRRNGPCYFDESETVSRMHAEAYVYERVLAMIEREVSADATLDV